MVWRLVGIERRFPTRAGNTDSHISGEVWQIRLGSSSEPSRQFRRDVLVAEKTLQIGDVRAQSEQPGGDSVTQQMRIDGLLIPAVRATARTI
jgi:hypothetical protein